MNVGWLLENREIVARERETEVKSEKLTKNNNNNNAKDMHRMTRQRRMNNKNRQNEFRQTENDEKKELNNQIEEYLENKMQLEHCIILVDRRFSAMYMFISSGRTSGILPAYMCAFVLLCVAEWMCPMQRRWKERERANTRT